MTEKDLHTTLAALEEAVNQLLRQIEFVPINIYPDDYVLATNLSPVNDEPLTIGMIRKFIAFPDLSQWIRKLVADLLVSQRFAESQRILKERNIDRWTEAQGKLAHIESSLIGITGQNTDIATNIGKIAAQQEQIRKLVAERDAVASALFPEDTPEERAKLTPAELAETAKEYEFAHGKLANVLNLEEQIAAQAAEIEELRKALETLSGLGLRENELLRKYDYVFDKWPAKPFDRGPIVLDGDSLTELGGLTPEVRWQALAFTIHTNLWEASIIAKNALDRDDDDDAARLPKRPESTPEATKGQAGQAHSEEKKG